MEPFTPFLTLLAEIEDPRRAEGKLYRLPHVMLFAIMAIVAGANSYRTIHTFIDVHLARLREVFHLPWRRAPAYTTIRGIIQQVDADSIEQVFRRHAAILHGGQWCDLLLLSITADEHRAWIKDKLDRPERQTATA